MRQLRTCLIVGLPQDQNPVRREHWREPGHSLRIPII
jgi:hypothetical protein